MLLKVSAGDTAGVGLIDWDNESFLTAGADIIPNLTDFDTASPANVSLSVTTPFTSEFTRTSLVTVTQHGIQKEAWYRQNSISTGDPLPVLELKGSGLTPGNNYLVKLAGIWFTDTRDFVYTVNGVSATYNNTTQSEPITPAAPVEITATAGNDGSGNGVLTITGDFGPSSDRVYLAFFTVEDAVGTGPTITDVDTDESVYPGQSFVITGTNFGATQGTGGVDIDGVAQTVTSWADTSITCTTVRGGNEYGTGKTLTVTTDAATTATIAVAQEAEPSTFFVTASSPNTTDDASLWTGLVDTATSNPITIVDGDQAWVKNPNNLENLSIAADGTITADDTGDFVVQIWLLSEGVWGTDQTVSFTLPSTSNAPIGKGNSRDMITFAAAGIVKGSYNERAIKYFRSNGATSRQYNHAEKQFEDN